MKTSILAMSLAVVVAAGCSTTNVTSDGSRASLLQKPARIIVYPFAATSADLAPEESGAYADPSQPPTAEQLRAARELGVQVAQRLVEEINEMGMHAEVGGRGSRAGVGDILIRGHFESVDEGSTARRWAIGFGSGKAEMRTLVAAYQVNERGLRRVGGGAVDSEGGKGPGLFVPIIVTAATANPIGLAVAGAAKVEGEITGRTTIEGAAKRTADAIAERMEQRFEDEGWI